MQNKILKITLFITSIISLISCDKIEENKDITVIYTTDVHCGLKDNLGYFSVEGYKDYLIENNNYVALVDAGDFLQGDFVGAISKGEYIVDIMNKMEYDVAVLGNHEFDYGIDILKERISQFNGDTLSCNLTYNGNNENKLKDVKPYVIKEYGNKKIGFVGVTTPLTITTSSPSNFIEDDKIVYNFSSSTKEEFYNVIQENIDKCSNEGADYVILLTHCGALDVYSPYSSKDIIANTNGYIAVMDGHAHINLDWTNYKNKDNKDIPTVDAGYKLNEFATLTIKKDGTIKTDYIKETDKKSKMMDEYINSILEKTENLGNEIVANIDIDLLTVDENGKRIVRNRETPIANLISDAYRVIGEADIGIVNGGGIRSDLYKGDVTYKEIKDVHPFGNVLTRKKVLGSAILDYLEHTTRFVAYNRLDEDGNPLGEFGGFPGVSNLKFDIDTSIKSSVEVDGNGYFVKVNGDRRIKNVKVCQNNEYVPLDENKEYVIASHNFLLNEGGDGANMFKNFPSLGGDSLFDYEVVVKYIVDISEGKLKDKYSTIDNRITII